jgi:MOSC domain-containing protein
MIVGHVREIWRYPVKSMGGGQLGDCRVTERGIPGDRGWAVRDEEAKEIRGAKNFPVLLQCAARYLEEPNGGGVPAAEITLPDGTKVRSDDPSVSAQLSKLIGRKVTLHSLRPATDLDHYRREKRLDEAGMRKLLGRTPDEPLPDFSTIRQEVLNELIEYTSPVGTYFDAFALHLVTNGWLDDLSRLNPQAKFDRRRFRPNFVIELAGGKQGRAEMEWMGKTIRIGDVRAKIESPCMRCSMTLAATGDLPKDPSVLRTIVRESGQNVGVYASIVGEGGVKVGDPVEVS